MRVDRGGGLRLLGWVMVGCGGPERTLPPPGECDTVGWNSFAGPFLQTWCTSCHSSHLTGEARNGAPVGADFDRWEVAASFAPAIGALATGMAPSMPPGGGPSADQRELVARWVACGAPGTPAAIDSCAAVAAFEGELPLASAAEVDAFCADYGAVVGNVVLEGAEALVVPCLCEVTGDVRLTGAETPSVSLPALRAVGGAVIVTDNPTLASWAAPLLDGVVGGAVMVARNPALAALDLHEVDTIGGDLVLEDLGMLAQLGLTDVVDVGGSVSVQRTGATALDLPRVETVGGDLTCRGNPSLVDVNVFESVTWVGGSFLVQENPGLLEVDGFYDLMEVVGDVVVIGNPALTALGGFGVLESAGGLTVSNNDQLGTVEAFRSLVEVDGDLTLEGNAVVAELPGLAAIESVTGDLTIVDNPLLPTSEATAISARAQVQGETVISGNGPQ